MLWKISSIFDSVQYTKKFQTQPKISFPQMVNLFGIVYIYSYVYIYIFMNNYEYTYVCVCVFLFNFNMQLPIQIHFVTTARWEPPCKDQEAFPSDNSVFS